MTKLYTDPIETLMEGPLDWAREKLTGVKQPEVVDSAKDLSNVKDVTPAAPDPIKASVNAMVSAYNEADVAAQIRFIELLIKHDGDKVRELMLKVKGM